jgi:nucleoside 2-deoxyribosyltransferase
MSTPTKTKCPLTGLEANEERTGSRLCYHIPKLNNIYTGIDYFYYGIDYKWTDLSKLLNSSQKGKLFQWVVQELRNKEPKASKTILIPEDYLNTEYTGTDSPLNQKITPTQKLNLLLEYIYHDLEEFGLTKALKHCELFPILATVEISTVERFMNILLEKKYICELNPNRGSDKSSHSYNFQHTLEGFEVYEAYRKGKADSDFGFMALKFGSKEKPSSADENYKKYWKPMVEKEFCPLHALYEEEKSEAGNINNIMEAQIRKCKFLIADVTPPEDTDTPNPNVMWEAGFAEGLNKPVFYVCDKNNTPKKRVFDIDHHNTLYYDSNNEEQMKEDCKRLKATIFNTLAKEDQLNLKQRSKIFGV